MDKGIYCSNLQRKEGKINVLITQEWKTYATLMNLEEAHGRSAGGAVC